MFLNFEGNNTIFDRMFILGFSLGSAAATECY